MAPSGATSLAGLGGCVTPRSVLPQPREEDSYTERDCAECRVLGEEVGHHPDHHPPLLADDGPDDGLDPITGPHGHCTSFLGAPGIRPPGKPASAARDLRAAAVRASTVLMTEWTEAVASGIVLA